MKKLALILSFIMCFSSTFFFAGCNTLTPKQNSNQNQEDLNDSNLQIQTSVQTQTIGGKTWYFVYTASELKELCGFSVNIKLCNSIDLSSYNTWRWQNYNNSTFDGQGYTITFKPDVSLNKNYALFENTNTSTIENLIIVADVEAYECSAALICYPKNTTIKNCTVMNSTITTLCTADSGYGVWAGGMVGKLNDSTIITNCMLINSSVTLTNSNGDSGSYVFMCGGIAAECDSTSTIAYCLVDNQNSNKISCMADQQSKTFVEGHNVYVGGVVGKLCNTLECCQNNSVVEGGNSQYTNASNVGGIAGLAEKKVSNCCNLGNVTAYAKKTELSGQALFNAGILTAVTSNAGTLTERIFYFKNDRFSQYYYGHYWPENEDETYIINNSGYVVGGGNFQLDGFWYSARGENFVYNIKLYECFTPSSINNYYYSFMQAYAGGIAGYSSVEASGVLNSYSVGNVYGGFKALKMNVGAYTWGDLTEDKNSSGIQVDKVKTLKNLKYLTSPIVGNETINKSDSNYYSGEIGTIVAVQSDDVVTYSNYDNYQRSYDQTSYVQKDVKFYSQTQFEGFFKLEVINKGTGFSWYLQYECRWCDEYYNGKEVVTNKVVINKRYHSGSASVYNINDEDVKYKGSKSSATPFTASNKTSLNNITDSPWLTSDGINNGYPYLKGLFY